MSLKINGNMAAIVDEMTSYRNGRDPRHPTIVAWPTNGRSVGSPVSSDRWSASPQGDASDNSVTSSGRMTSGNDDDADGGGGGGGESIELFVKAGKDGRRLGGCPLCQRVHLALAFKSTFVADGGIVADPRRFSFVVTPVNMSRPPPDFCRLQPSTRRLPVLVHRRRRAREKRHAVIDGIAADVDDDERTVRDDDDEVLTDPDDILQYVDMLFPVPSMAYDTAGAASVVCRDVFSRFSYFVKDVSGSAGPLLAELRRLDAHLSATQQSFRYLNGGERPDHLDCIVLPKLQHIRVTARAVKDFEIPTDLHGLWRYLATAYADPVFRRTCPSDQEIVHHWQSKPECHRLPKSKQLFYSPEGVLRYSMDVPAEIGRPDAALK